MSRSITILGATGSVGRSTLDLVARNRERYRIVALTAHNDVAGLAELARRFRPRQAVIGDAGAATALREALAGTGIQAAAGESAIDEAAASGADWTMAAIVGTAGLKPVMRALEGGGTVALANKEALVSAGALMTGAARASGATLLPVDSEHNAVFQCFDRARPDKRAPDHPHRQRRPVPDLADRADAGGDRGRGGRPPQLVDGRQDLGRFGDADEQGAGADRGLSPLPGRRPTRSRSSSTRNR